MDYSKLSDQELEKLAFGKGPRFKDESVKQEYSGLEAVPKAILAESTARVTSGKRTPETNKAVGGVPTSFHLTGKAFDLGKDESALPVIEKAKNYGYKVLDEGDHYHFQPQKGGKINYSALSKSELEQLAFDGPPPIPQQAAQEKKPELMGAPEASLRGAASAVPFSGTISGALRTIPAFRAMAQVLGGNLEQAPKEYEKGFFGFDPSQFSRGRETFNVQEQRAAREQPEAYTLTKLAAELPQYIAGGEALKAIPALSGTGMLPAMGRGAISNLGVSQVHDFDPMAAPIQVATGLAGEPIARGIGAGLKGAGKLGQFLKFKQPGVGAQLQEYGFQWGAKGLQKANLAKSQELTQGLDDIFTTVGKDLPIEAPSSMNADSIKSVYRKFRGGAHSKADQEVAKEIKGLIDIVESNQPIPLSSAQRLKGAIGKIAYDEKGLRKTQSAKSFSTIYNDLKDQITNTIDNASPGSGEAYTKLNSQLEKTAKIGSFFKPELTEGIEKGVGYKNKGLMEKILEGGLTVGGVASLPGVSIPTYAAYKALQTTPVFTGLPVAGEAIKQTGPLLNPILNQIIQSLANQ